MPSNSDTYIKIGADVNEFDNKIRTVKRSLDDLGTGIDRQIPASIRLKDILANTAGMATKLTLGIGAVTAGLGALYYAMDKMAQPASDLLESMSKTEQIFGRLGSRSMFDWADDAAEKLGASKQEALELSSTMGNMFSQLGLGRDRAGELSRGMLELSADIASFNNVSGGAAQVSDTMLSAFRGEYDALQRYIPTIKAASVQQQALADTGKTSADQLTELEKTLAAVEIITRDAGAAVGDFERTSDGYANTTRRLSAEWEDFSAVLGQKFLPMATSIKGITADILSNLSEAIAGPSLEEQLAAAKSQLEALKDINSETLRIEEARNIALERREKLLGQSGISSNRDYSDVYGYQMEQGKTFHERQIENLETQISLLEEKIKLETVDAQLLEAFDLGPIKKETDAAAIAFERLDAALNGWYSAMISGGPDAKAEMAAFNTTLEKQYQVAVTDMNALSDLRAELQAIQETIDPTIRVTNELNTAFETLSDALMQGLINDEEFQKLIELMEFIKKHTKEVEGTFNDAAIAAQTAMRSMQQAFDSGDKGYAAMGVAIEAVNAVLAVSAILNQASGDPYTAFARMAAMAATVISLGQSIGNFNAGETPEAPSSSPTTGTVFGNAEAASQSISNSFDMLNEWNDLQYNELRGIHDEVRDLNNSLTAVATALVRSVGQFNEDLYSGIDFGSQSAFDFDRQMRDLGLDGLLSQEQFSAVLSAIPEQLFAQALEDVFGQSQLTDVLTFLPDLASDLFGSLLGGILGGGRETELIHAGVEIGGTTIANILDGIQTGIRQYGDIRITTDGGWFGSDSTSYARQYLDASDDTVRLFNQVYSDMATVLVGLAESFEVPLDVIRAYDLELQRLDLMDLTGEEIQQRLTEWASTILDTAVSDLFGDIIGKYQRIDEGLLETATRLLNDLAVVNKLAEMTRTSINATGLAAYDMSEALIRVAGDLETLTENVQSYYEAFISEGERHQDLVANLTEYFNQLGVAMPDSREGFRGLVEGIDLTTEAGQQLYVALTGMASAMDTVYSAQEEISDATSGLVESLTQMVVPLTEYEQTVPTMTPAGEAAQQTWIDNGMAIDQATGAAQSMIDYFTGAVTAMDEAQTVAANAKSTLESIQTYRSSLSSSAYSTLMPDQVLANALAEFRASDLEGLPSLADTLLEAARGALADPAEYQRIFDEVSNRLAAAEQEAQQQVDMAALQVSILQEQINQLQNVNLTLEGIEDLLSRFTGSGFADGGISTGSTSGHLEVLHGDEAIIPLNNGSVPVRVYGGGDDETKALLSALLTEVREGRIQSRKLYNMLDQITGGESSFQTRDAE